MERHRGWMGWGIVALAVLSWVPCARADDASFYGDGSTVYALKEDRIVMKKETVVVRSDPHSSHQDWTADCTFVFVNTRSTEVLVQMGFPDWRPFGDGADSERWAILDFKVEVDGQAVNAVHKAVDPKAAKGVEPLPAGMAADYHGAYTWTVRFPPNGTVTVHNSYRFGGLLTNGPFSYVYEDPAFPKKNLPFWRASGRNKKVGGCDFDDALLQRIQYIVTTARTWGGPIGEADIAIQIPPRVLPHQVIPSVPATSFGGGMFRWHFTGWTPTREIALFVARPIGETCDMRAPLFATLEQARAWMRFAKANGVRRDVVELLRDAYLARRGARFPDEARNAYFAERFRESGALDDSEKGPLSPREAKIVSALDAFARTLPAGE